MNKIKERFFISMKNNKKILLAVLTLSIVIIGIAFFIITINEEDMTEDTDALAQADFAQILYEENFVDKPLLANTHSDGTINVYIPIANGKYTAHTFNSSPEDDFILYDSAMVGTINENQFNVEQYLMAGSNKEFAFYARPANTEDKFHWFPSHGVGTTFMEEIKLTFDDEEIIFPTSTTELEEVEKVQLVQHHKMIYPGKEKPIGEVRISTTINQEGVHYDGEVTWLEEVELDRGYVTMFPTLTPPFQTLLTSLDGEYDLSEPTGITNVEEGMNIESYAFINDENEFAIAQTINDPNHLFVMNETEHRPEDEIVWIEHRSEEIKKLYPQVYQNDTVDINETIEFNSRFYSGLLNDPRNYLQSQNRE
jgi:hypothetical protein